MKRRTNTIRAGFTLTELIMVVAVLAILMAIAIPRMGWGMMDKMQAETTARKFSDHLKLARSLAISNAGSNPDGYEVRVYINDGIYKVIHGATLKLVKPLIYLPEGVTMSASLATTVFDFTPLGKLQSGTTKTVQFTKSGNTSIVTVTAIGRITVQ
ncbi:MAG: prepilin-type N-terminal cleavage/methylation domain-containing protein [Planctomycetes bacterium]|nr:prepilin-type N-terminal cleavage/methylation domain-containing protein [Planctomycetota bacterium]